MIIIIILIIIIIIIIIIITPAIFIGALDNTGSDNAGSEGLVFLVA